MSKSVTAPRNWSIAFLFFVLVQFSILLSAVPKLMVMLANVGAYLPPITVMASKYYWVGCLAITAVSGLSAAYLVTKRKSAQANTAKVFHISLVSLVAAFIWSAIIVVALYRPIFKLAEPI